MKYLVTGAAGFIGMYTAKRLLDMGHDVVGFNPLICLKEALGYRDMQQLTQT